MSQPPILVRRARPGEAGDLSALALRSKASWGYDVEFLEQCHPVLTYSEDDCTGQMFVAELDAQVAGLARLTGTPPTGCLEDLFVDPWAMGRGVGSTLLGHLREQARAMGFQQLELDADPNARTFYELRGAAWVRDVPSDVVSGRALPRMRMSA